MLYFLLIKELFSTLITISEGSCDTEDWSNDHRNKLHIKIYLQLHFKLK